MPETYPPNNGLPLRNDVVPGDGTGTAIDARHAQAIIDALGVNPKGSHPTVQARFEAAESAIGDKAAANHDHSGVYAPVAHSHVAGEITDGVLDPERLGTGTTGSGRYLAGTGEWRPTSELGGGGGTGGGNIQVIDLTDSIDLSFPVGTVVLRRIG